MKPYIIIGGGIIGTTIAREIRIRDLGEVIILEKENKLGMHASGRNSGVLHSGISHVKSKDSLKVRLCLNGNKESKEFCENHGVKYEECGKLIIARNESEMPRLESLFNAARKIGVPGIRIINREEIKQFEPNAKGCKAVFSPTDAIVDSHSFLDVLAKEAISLGCKYLLNREVLDIKEKIITTKEDFEFSHLINCSGLYADRIAHIMNLGREYSIIPFKGEYMKVNTDIRSMIYQVPDPEFPFLKVHLTKTINGEVLAGPTSGLSLGGRESYSWKGINTNEFLEQILSRNFWKLVGSKKFRDLAYQNAAVSLFKNRFIDEINNLIENSVSREDISKHRSGIRAQLVDKNGRMIDDIVIKEGENSTHILNAISPGMTYALSFAKYFVSEYIEKR